MTFAPEELISQVFKIGSKSGEIGIYYIKNGEVEATLHLNKKEAPLKLETFQVN